MKGVPSSLARFDKTSELQQEFASSSALPQQATSSFRTASTRSEEVGVDSDYGRFASTSSAARGEQVPAGFAGSWSGTEGRGQVDGEDVMALLGSGEVGEGVYGDWEQVLMEDQYRKREMNDSKPLDPAATTTGNAGQLAEHESTTSDEQLISSLSSLDLSARSYLRTLLALPVETSIIDYLQQNRYTDDVYALPKEVRSVLEEAEQLPGVSAEEGRVRAVRRLEKVLQHLSLTEEALATTLPPTSTFPLAVAQPLIPPPTIQRTSQAPSTIPPPTQRPEWTGDFSSIAAQHTYRRRPEQRIPSAARNDRSMGGDVLESANGKRSPLSDSLQRRMDAEGGENR